MGAALQHRKASCAVTPLCCGLPHSPPLCDICAQFRHDSACTCGTVILSITYTAPLHSVTRSHTLLRTEQCRSDMLSGRCILRATALLAAARMTGRTILIAMRMNSHRCSAAVALVVSSGGAAWGLCAGLLGWCVAHAAACALVVVTAAVKYALAAVSLSLRCLVIQPLLPTPHQPYSP